MDTKIEEIMKEAGIDVEEALERVVGNHDIFLVLLREFLKEKHFDELKIAMEDKDVEYSFQCGHALKGVSANLSLNTLHDTLETLVEDLRGHDFEKAVIDYARVEEEYAKTRYAVEQYIISNS